MLGDSCMLAVYCKFVYHCACQNRLQKQVAHAHQLQPHLHNVTTNCWVLLQYTYALQLMLADVSISSKHGIQNMQLNAHFQAHLA